uniref:Uncharacterized protein n=1 Tax=Meloidogyne enterolobii TaxID=390850 RepID=A0A6V7TZD9_MELEN|nr:unnamed protein product [Meloidogyne enterolobii]
MPFYNFLVKLLACGQAQPILQQLLFFIFFQKFFYYFCFLLFRPIYFHLYFLQ